jgi:alpha-1,3-rhamnosyl/mannosyltransferase
MNVTVDATSLLLPGAGIKTYLHYWLSALMKAASEGGDIVRTYPPSITAEHLPDHGTASRSALRLLMVNFCNIPKNPVLRLMLGAADVFHASQHLANMPRSRDVTATVFDFSCWTMPQVHTPANVVATKRYGENILKASTGLIAISAHARQDAMEILGIPGERIRVIYPGVAEIFFSVTGEQTANVRTKYDLHAPYMLFVGCIEPRKNVPRLIQAYLNLPEAVRREVQLIIAGPLGWESQETYRMLSSSGEQVRYLGYVAEQDLPGLLGGAIALVYPSHYEGFGLPVAQAMAAGRPVITSNRSSLPEVAGAGGLLVDPDCPDQLTDAMLRLATDSQLATDLATRGRERASLFRWPASARKSLDFFHEIAGK